MPLNLRSKYDPSVREAAAELFEKGFGYHSASTALGLPPGTVEKWFCAYRSLGLEGLLAMGAKQAKYTYEQKLAAVEEVVVGGASYADAMAAHGIASLAPLQKWCKAYREGGAEALRPKPKGRPKGPAAQPKELTREQELEVQVRKLQAENAYLKKLAALRAEEALRTGPRPRW